MRVEQIMTKDVAACDPQTNAAAAAELMWQRNCGALPVVENGGRLVGMVTDRDLFIALGTRDERASCLPVESIMHREVATCEPTDDVSEALKTMADRQLQRLAVVGEQGDLCGILSMDDIVLHSRDKGHGPSAKEIVQTMRAICERQVAQDLESHGMHAVA